MQQITKIFYKMLFVFLDRGKNLLEGCI